MPESTELIDTQFEEIPSTQSPTPPPYGAPQPSAFKRLLQKALDRFQRILAKVTPLIKANPWIAWGTGVGLVVAVGFGAWHLHQSRTTVPTSPQATKIVKRQGASHKPQGNRVPTNPQAAKIAKLQALARDAYKKANYAVPVQTSSIAYSKRVLALDPSNNSSRTLLAKSVSGGKYQVQQALKHKDFAKAHRVANAMGQLLPGHKDIAQLQQQVRIAERGAAAPRGQKVVAQHEAVAQHKTVARQKAVPRQKPVPKVSFTAYHLHSGKAPADHGPYCLGVLSVTGKHLKFVGRSASSGQKVHKLDFACSDIREIKKNARIASRQGGFRVSTVSAKMNFAPRDSSLTHVSALASACSN
jgi:hypothetical protein